MFQKLNLIRLFLAIAMAPLLALARNDSAVEKPNIVMIAADDLGWADVGYHNSEIKTP